MDGQPELGLYVPAERGDHLLLHQLHQLAPEPGHQGDWGGVPRRGQGARRVRQPGEQQGEGTGPALPVEEEQEEEEEGGEETGKGRAGA